VATTADPPPYVVLLSAGEPETGLWCGRCLLPSRIRVPFCITSEQGSFLAGTAEGCPDCGEGMP
jgi:hypothetical protein